MSLKPSLKAKLMINGREMTANQVIWQSDQGFRKGEFGSV